MAETIDELKQQIIDRFAELSNEEKAIIESMVGTQELKIIAKVLGPDITNVMRLQPAPKPRKRGLGTR